MAERKTRYCSNCGAEIDARAKICPKCGVEQVPLVEEVSSAWYLVPFFFGIIGGLIAWFVNKDRNPKKSRNLLIFGTVWTVILIILVWIIVASLFVAVVTPKVKQVYIKVEYAGEWQGAYGDQSGIVSWSGTGTKTVTLSRPGDAYMWIVSANAQKMDDSNDVLTIKIMKTDGTILKEASTTAPYGVAQVAYNVD